jgi:ATP-dependent helicase HrpA
MRFEKLRSGGEVADRQGTEELRRYWQKYLDRKELHDLAGIADPELDVFRWMIEEYRVSLFAQRLGTSMKVSPQRLDKQFEKVRR